MLETRFPLTGTLAGHKGFPDYSQLSEEAVKSLCDQRGFVGEYSTDECVMLLGLCDTGVLKNGSFDLHVSTSGVSLYCFSRYAFAADAN